MPPPFQVSNRNLGDVQPIPDIAPQINLSQADSPVTRATVKGMSDLLNGRSRLSDLLGGGIPEQSKQMLQDFAVKLSQSLMTGAFKSGGEAGFAVGNMLADATFDGTNLTLKLTTEDGREVLSSSYRLDPAQFISTVFSDAVKQAAQEGGSADALLALVTTAREVPDLEDRRKLFNQVFQSSGAPSDIALDKLSDQEIADLAFQSVLDMQLTEAEQRAKRMMQEMIRSAGPAFSRTPQEQAEHLRLLMMKHEAVMADIIESAMNGTPLSFPPMPSFVETHLATLKQACRSLFIETMSPQEQQSLNDPIGSPAYFRADPKRVQTIVSRMPDDVLLGFEALNRKLDSLTGDAQFSIWNVSLKQAA